MTSQTLRNKSYFKHYLQLRRSNNIHSKPAASQSSIPRHWRSPSQLTTPNMTRNSKWWQTATIYELYPSSFADSNGDGIGDIPGIISRIPYLASLGIDAVWLAACYQSGGVDMGYDVVDYRNIDERYGTVSDVEKLIAELRKHSISLIMDSVVNHTSSEHAWFKESRSNETNPKRDWYIWRKGFTMRTAEGELKRYPPNNWESVFKGSAWEYDETTDSYYLRMFAKEQPDLNWDCKQVRQAVYKDMRFWLDKGVAGFRMDVINMISKPEGLPDAPVTNPKSDIQKAVHLTCNGPRVHDYLKEMRREVFDHYPDSVSVGEVICTDDPSMIRRYVETDRREIDMVYTYDLFGLDCGPNGKFSQRLWTLSEFKTNATKWQVALFNDAWQTFWLESHDSGRSVSRFGDRTPENREEVAKMLAMLASTMQGTLFLYQGQELGLINLDPDIPLSEYQDVETKNTWNAMLQYRAETSGLPVEKVDMSDALKEVHLKARDHARAPLPWTSGPPPSGFSTTMGKTWTPMNTDADVCNITAQGRDPDSVLNYWRRRLQIRKKYPEALVYGAFEPVQSTLDNGPVFAYWRKPGPDVIKARGLRKDGNRDVLVVLNLTAQEGVDFELPITTEGKEERYFMLDSTAGNTEGLKLRESGLVGSMEKVRLEAYQGVVFGY